MKSFIISLVIILIFYGAAGQTFGLSADKLVALNPKSIPTGTLEFEPAYGYLWSSKYFNNSGQMIEYSPENDSMTLLHSLVFRTTYGFAKNFEIGTLITSDLSAFSAGIKFTFFQSENTAGAIILGTTFSNESDLIFRNTGFYGKTCHISTGLVFTHVLSEKFEVDYDFQYQNVWCKTGSECNDFFSNADFSYQVKKGLRVASGLSYRLNQDKSEMINAYALTMNNGLIISPGETFILVMNIPIDLYGKNTEKYSGFTVALTIFLD